MEFPKISIITITFNSEKTIETTIESVLSQNYENFEYIIVDGLSTDSTLDIVFKYKDKISKIISEKDRGISDAFNKGVRNAEGEIIGIVNSDDILMPGALKTIANNYQKDIDVYSGVVLFWNDQTGETFPSYPDVKFDKLKLQYGVAHPSRFIRKDAYEKYGLYVEQLRYNMDMELLCRFYKKGAKFQYIDKPLTMFRIGGTTADSIYKKKDDFRYFVQSFGGTKWDFRWLWFKSVVKYNLIVLGYKLFGSDLKFKLSKISWLNSFVKKAIDKLF